MNAPSEGVDLCALFHHARQEYGTGPAVGLGERLFFAILAFQVSIQALPPEYHRYHLSTTGSHNGAIRHYRRVPFRGVFVNAHSKNQSM